MPAYRKILAKRDLENITKFVKALSEGHGDREPVGKKIFQNVGCTACHGADAKGSKTIGAVNLTDDIWRFDGSINGIRRTISFGVNSGDPRDRISTMPKFLDAGKLSALEIKKLAIYVYTLSNRHDER
jgi:cytochrome c oxidase cbb3-type subunit 3